MRIKLFTKLIKNSKMKNFFLIPVFLLLFVSVSKAQIYDYPLKAAIYGGTVYTYSKSPTGLFQICKYSGTDLIWQYIYQESGFSDAYIYDLVEGDGDVYAIGKIRDITDYKIILIKVNNDGALGWVKYLDYNAEDDAGLAIAYDRGEVYFTGLTTNSLQQTDVLVNRYTQKGVESWNRVLMYNFNPDNSNDVGSKILVDSNFVYVCGTTIPENSITTDVFMMTLSKYDGSVVDAPVVHEIPGANEYLTDFTFFTHSGNSTITVKNITGITVYSENIRNNTKDYGVLLFKGGLVSEVLWERIYKAGSLDEVAAKIMISNDSNVIVTGYAQRSLYDYDFMTMKHSRGNGVPMWSDSIIYYPPNVPSDGKKKNTIDMASALAKKGNEIYVAGFSESAGNQFIIQRIIDDPSPICSPLNISYSPNFAGDYMPDQYKMKAFLGVDEATGNIISVFAKANINNDADIDYAIVKFDSTGDIISETETINNEPEYSNNNNSNQLRIYPNPFNPETKIQFNLPASSLVKIKIYDILGKEVFTMNELRPAGINNVSFKANNLASGIYYLKIQTANSFEARKLILLK